MMNVKNSEKDIIDFNEVVPGWIDDIAGEMIRNNSEGYMIFGIVYDGSVNLSDFVSKELEKKIERQLPTGQLDPTLYHCDILRYQRRQVPGTSYIPEPVDGKRILLVQDVFTTGRTARAAMEMLKDFGRDGSIELACLVNNSYHSRCLPIVPNYNGMFLELGTGYHPNVDLDEKIIRIFENIKFE